MKEKVRNVITWVLLVLLLLAGQNYALQAQLRLLSPVEARYCMPFEVETDGVDVEDDPKEENLPEEEVQVSQSGTETPENEPETRSKEEDLPEEEVQTPESGTETPKNESEPPPEEEELPGEEVQTPENGTETPKNESEIPSEEENLPAEEVQMPENGTELPEGGAQTPEEEPEVIYPVLVDGFYIDEQQMITSIDPSQAPIEDGYLELPAEGCIGIRSGALVSCGNLLIEIYVPGNLLVLEEGAFSGLPAMEWLEIDSGNPNYTSIDGVIYNADATTILAVPGARTGTQLVPGTVKCIGDRALDGTRLDALDMRKCGEISLGSNIFGSGSGAGIVIHIDGSLQEFYQNIFAGYQVEIKGYNR